jgi:hypothetical protein
MKRTTIKQVNDALASLNIHLGVKEGEKGSFCIQGAYGGWQLQRHAECGIVSIGGYKSKREVYEMIHNIAYGVLIAPRRDTN